VAYVCAALVFHWPLPLRLGSAFTGPVNGDTGVYVWNLWVFHHEIVANRHSPLFTNEILTLSPPIDLSLHNYTLFANVLGFPLVPLLGVVRAFNVVFLLLTALTGWTMFLLARRVVGRVPEAWMAGLLFAFSPVLVARSTGHFSLVAAAPLPVFILCLMRLERDASLKNAVWAGATIAWASTCDVYFGVYCLLIGACYLVSQHTRLSFRQESPVRGLRLSRAIDALLVGIAAVVMLIAVTGGTELRVLGQTIGLKSLYTPVLVLTVLVLLRLALRWRPILLIDMPTSWMPAIRSIAVAGATCVLLLSPVLYALWFRLADGGTLHQPILWRSGPRGVDLLAFFTPNPNHKLFGEPWRAWYTGQPNGYAENVAALTWTGLIVVGLAIWRYRLRPPHVWTVLSVFFGLLALGPFVHIGGVNTFVPGPWILLRYVPILSATRMPQRFAIVLMMAFAVIFALAVAHIADRFPRRRALLSFLGVLLAFELAPMPRRAPTAPIPGIYRIIAADPRDVAVLGIPFGVADGEGGEGRYNPASQFYQTVHLKRIVGGSLSRITQNEHHRQRSGPVRHALLLLSERSPLDRQDYEAAKEAAPRFVSTARLGYVIVDKHAASPELRQFVIDIFGLVKMAESDDRELFRPTVSDSFGDRRPAHDESPRRGDRHDGRELIPSEKADSPLPETVDHAQSTVMDGESS
jgi:hypothetical protein